MSAEALMDDGMCFACGRRNPCGLGLRFEFDGREASAPLTFEGRFQGYRDVVHGGLISTALDEAMVTVLNRCGELALTAELTVRFLAPARIGEPLRVAATLVSRRGGLSRMEARLMRQDGTELARAAGTYFRVRSLPGDGAAPGDGRS
jgi:uncharacterized protein (TIGR00369 family)